MGYRSVTMKLLTNNITETVSAGMSHGQLNHLGTSYPIQCSLVSQSCLNSYIHYLEFDFASEHELMLALFSAMHVCDGPYGLLDVGNCTKFHLEQINKSISN